MSLPENFLVLNDPLFRLLRLMSPSKIYAFSLIFLFLPLATLAWWDGTLLPSEHINSSFLREPAVIVSWLICIPLLLILFSGFYNKTGSYLCDLAMRYPNVSELHYETFAGCILKSYRLPLLCIAVAAAIIIPCQIRLAPVLASRGIVSWHFTASGYWTKAQYLYTLFIILLNAELCILILKYGYVLYLFRRILIIVGAHEIHFAHPDNVWGFRGLARPFLLIYYAVLLFAVILASLAATSATSFKGTILSQIPIGVLASAVLYFALGPIALLAPSLVTGLRRLIQSERQKLLSQLREEYDQLLSKAIAKPIERASLTSELKSTQELIHIVQKTPTWIIDPSVLQRLRRLYIALSVIVPLGTKLLIYQPTIGRFVTQLLGI